MRRGREHVDALSLYVYRQVTDRLYRVGVEGDLACAAYGSDLRYRLYGADLVVGRHHGDQTGVVAYRGGELVDADDAVLVNRQQSDLKAFPLELLERVQDGVVFKGGGNDVGLSVPFAPDGG